MKYLIPVSVVLGIIGVAVVILWALPRYFLVYLAIVIALNWIYILWVREWLAHKSPWAEKVQWLHNLEDVLWDRSRTILTSRLYWVGGIVVAIHEALVQYGVDWTPVTQQLSQFVPEKWRGLAIALFLALTGITFEWLRHMTTKSLTERKEG